MYKVIIEVVDRVKRLELEYYFNFKAIVTLRLLAP